MGNGRKTWENHAFHTGAACFEEAIAALLSSQGELSHPGDALGLSSWGTQMTGTDDKALCFAMLSFSNGSRS